MVLRKLAVALLSVGVMLPGLGHALAVKDVQTKSALGEPFQAEVELADLGDLNADEIKVSLATQEDFDRLGIERGYFLSDLRFDVVVNPGGRSFIKVSTNKPVREPYLDFVVRIAWPGNARLQNVTALLDPPVAQESKPAPVSQPVSTTPAAPAPAPVAPTPAPSTETSAAPVRLPPPAPVVTAKAPTAKKPVPAAPAPQPAEKPAATTSGEYRVQAGDTLSRIVANEVNTQASTAQAMVAIQRANPSAFANGNINQLRRGQVLRIPTDAEIREVNAREASASVREQSQAWRNTAAQAPALSAQQVDATAKPEKPVAAAPAASKPEMKLLGAKASEKGGTATAGAEKGGAADAATLKGNQAKAAAAKAEKDKLAAKVGTLDAAVKTNDKQLQVQNAKLADLNAKLKAQNDKAAAAAPAAKAAPAAPAVAAPAATTPPAATPAPAAPVATPAAVEGATPAPTGVATNAVEAAPAIQSTPLPEKPKAAPAPIVQDETVAEESLPLPLLGGGAALLALLGGGFWWSRKRRQEKLDEEAALAELEASEDHHSNLGASDNFSFDTEPEANDWNASFDAAPAVSAAPAAVQDRVLADPLEEVDQYLAFERYPQAIGFLNKAIASSPDRSDLRLKLLEVYAHVDDWNGFVEQEAWFESQGDLNALARAEELKVGLTPPARKPSADDPLPYHEENNVASLEDLEMDFNASVSASSPALQAIKDEDLQLNDDFSFDTNLDTPAVEASATAATLDLDDSLDFTLNEKSEPVAEDHSFDLDADFDLGEKNIQVETIQVETSAADEGMDFSLDEELPEADFTPKGGSLGDLVDFDEAPELKEPEVKVTEDDLSFSLDDLEASAASTSTDLDGDFSLETAGADISFDETLQVDSGMNNAAADFDAMLSMDAPAAAPVAAPAAAPAASDDIGLDDEFDFLADSDENATKLDLARAYIDMGDMEGARDILQEVLSEGSANQKDEAKGLLAQVS